MPFCTSCGAPLEGAAFCMKCGTKADTPPPGNQVCQDCKTPLRPDDKFCLNCGHPISTEPDPAPTPVPETPTVSAHDQQPRFIEASPQTPKVSCSYCSAELETDDQFCINCGTPRHGAPPQEERRKPWLLPVAIIAAIVLLGGGGWWLVGELAGDEESVGTESAARDERSADEVEPDDSDVEVTTVAPTTAVPTTVPATTTTTAQTPASVLLNPVGAAASNTRSSVSRLRCGGSNSFEAERIIDGDFNTGWGAASGDGSGQWVRIDFAQEVHLTVVGLTPGYLRVAPRYDQDCAEVLAFPYNRFVVAVEYRFDDGSTIRQDFLQEATMQFEEVDVVTRSVTITILTTRKTIDEDTIISDAQFFGYTE